MPSERERRIARAIKNENAPPKALDKMVKRQLRISAGVGDYSNKDPIYHLSEGFRQTFDLAGSKRSAERNGDTAQNIGETQQNSRLRQDGGTGLEVRVPGLETKPESGDGVSKALDGAGTGSAFGAFDKTSMDSVFAPTSGKENDRFVNRFSDTAFSRGSMAGAVMRGTGQMMLMTSLNRVSGRALPKNMRQRKLFQSGASKKSNIKGHQSDKAIFNAGVTESAVGLVVDVLKDTRRTVDELAELSEGGNALRDGSGAETLRTAYPFLSDSKERELLNKFKDMAERAKSSEQRSILQRAANKTQAQIERKQQMRLGFSQHLRFLSGRAQAAIVVFESEAFREELAIRGFVYDSPEPPPNDKLADDAVYDAVADSDINPIIIGDDYYDNVIMGEHEFYIR